MSAHPHKYQLKNPPVEAFQFQSDRAPLWFVAGVSRKEIWSYENYCVIPTTHTKTGKQRVDTGHWIIKLPDGSLSAMTPEEFNGKYELINPIPPSRASSNIVQEQGASA